MKQTLLQYFTSLPGSHDAQILYALILGALAGMLANYVRGRAKGDISGSLVDYFFRDNVWRSLASAGAVLAELFTEMESDIFTTAGGEFIGWGLVLLSGLKTGFGLDLIVNKSSRSVWTPEQRAAAAAPPKEQKP